MRVHSRDVARAGLKSDTQALCDIMVSLRYRGIYDSHRYAYMTKTIQPGLISHPTAQKLQKPGNMIPLSIHGKRRTNPLIKRTLKTRRKEPRILSVNDRLNLHRLRINEDILLSQIIVTKHIFPNPTRAEFPAYLACSRHHPEGGMTPKAQPMRSYGVRVDWRGGILNSCLTNRFLDSGSRHISTPGFVLESCLVVVWDEWFAIWLHSTFVREEPAFDEEFAAFVVCEYVRSGAPVNGREEFWDGDEDLELLLGIFGFDWELAWGANLFHGLVGLGWLTGRWW